MYFKAIPEMMASNTIKWK